MNVTLAYLGRSGLRAESGGRVLQFEPNLARDRVSFDAALKQPLRFREAISSLHDVVISDLRFKPRDKTAYEEWKRQQQRMEAELRRTTRKQAAEEILARSGIAVPPDLERTYHGARARYWKARQAYASYLLKHDAALWRKLMPCDPVITVADDVVFFECFSADESSYGCLTVEREATFAGAGDVRCGTTNVDYSWDLYEHFQTLRTYRETRFRVDPAGFEVATQGRADYREEKIDLPPGWLRGFLQIQVAMGLPMRRVSLPVEAVYSLLAWLRRHREKTGPRAIRFELLSGKTPRLVLEPWEQPIDCHGTVYHGPDSEPVRIWGRRRLLALARVLPLADGIDVYLLGTGFPSFWLVRMGSMRLVLGLSGWTANDWTRGSSLDMLAPPQTPSEPLIVMGAEMLQKTRAATFGEIDARLGGPPAMTAAVLNHLAHTGQVIYDLGAQRYRWRQVLPMALGEEQLGPPNPEFVAASEHVRSGKVTIEKREDIGAKKVLVTGSAGGKPCELLINADGLITRGKCVCSHHFKFGIRSGPCQHIQALRFAAMKAEAAESPDAAGSNWHAKLLKWAGQ